MKINKIYLGNFLELCSKIPNGSIDLIVTSPPYNVGMEYEEIMPLNEYLDFIKDTFKIVYDLLKNGGRVAINIANTGRKPYIPLASYYNLIMIDLGYLMRGEIIWNKGASAGNSTAWGSFCSASNPVLRDQHEYILVFSKKDYNKIALNNDIQSNEFIEYTKSIWNIQTESATKIGHPAPFPIEIPSRLIKLYSAVNDIVLDPFLGSGTTCVAAKTLDRKYIGFEKEVKYYKIAQSRLSTLF